MQSRSPLLTMCAYQFVDDHGVNKLKDGRFWNINQSNYLKIIKVNIFPECSELLCK